MRTVIIFSASICVSFFVGAFFGAEAYRRFTRAQLLKVVPLIQNAVADLMGRFAEGNITKEEMIRLGREEMNFIDIAMKTNDLKPDS